MRLLDRLTQRFGERARMKFAFRFPAPLDVVGNPVLAVGAGAASAGGELAVAGNEALQPIGAAFRNERVQRDDRMLMALRDLTYLRVRLGGPARSYQIRPVLDEVIRISL